MILFQVDIGDGLPVGNICVLYAVGTFHGTFES